VARFLIAPDKFKGSLSAIEVAESIAAGILSVQPDAELDLAPIADGGEGTAAILARHFNAERKSFPTLDPLGRPIVANYFLGNAEAIIEMSEASGLWRIQDTTKKPLASSTYGTGLLIRHLISEGADRILIGMGGSATVDVGLGMAAALGFQFFDEKNHLLDPVPVSFPKIWQITPSSSAEFPPVIGLFDVDTRLTGIEGATHTFGAQKGLTPEEIVNLDSTIAILTGRIESALGTNFSQSPGAGAAGGFGYGILTFLNGSLVSGFDYVARCLSLREKIRAADVVITGEGKIDAQSLRGKGPFGVASMAHELGKPVWAVAGSVGDYPLVEPYFQKIGVLISGDVTLERALHEGKALLRQRAREFFV
jgi:glycerate kinase